MILPMLPKLKPDFVWIIVDDMYTVHNGLLPSMEVPTLANNAYRHYVLQDLHGQGCAATSQLLQAAKGLTDAGNFWRSWNAWETQQMAKNKALSILSVISTTLIGLMIPSAVTTVMQLLSTLLERLYS